MEKREGLFIYRVEVLVAFDRIADICVPIEFSDNSARILDYNNATGSWSDYSSHRIDNYVSKSEDDFFAELQDQLSPILSAPKIFLKELLPILTGCGETFPLIYRPLFYQYPDTVSFIPFVDNAPAREYYKDPPINNLQQYSNSLRQLEIILDDLESIFRVLTPNRRNKKAYGNAIRNVIIMACTEIDMLMKYTLKQNGKELTDNQYNTNEYVKLLEPMRLNEYQLSFNRHGLGLFSPFWRWSKDNTTKSIWWYDAYNKIKHDREGNFKLANLGNAVNAVMALAIVLIAQYGYRNDLWDEKVGKIICVKKEPRWELKNFYYPPNEGNPFVEKVYF